MGTRAGLQYNDDCTTENICNHSFSLCNTLVINAVECPPPSQSHIGLPNALNLVHPNFNLVDIPHLATSAILIVSMRKPILELSKCSVDFLILSSLSELAFGRIFPQGIHHACHCKPRAQIECTHQLAKFPHSFSISDARI